MCSPCCKYEKNIKDVFKLSDKMEIEKKSPINNDDTELALLERVLENK